MNIYLTNTNIKLDSITKNTAKTAHHIKGLAGVELSSKTIDILAKRLSSYTGFSYSEIRIEILNALGIQTSEGEY